MKSVVFAFFLASLAPYALAVIWADKGSMCLPCINPFDPNRPSPSTVYCLVPSNCQYNSFSNCNALARAYDAKACGASGGSTQSTSCDAITQATLTSTPQPFTVTLGANEFCTFTVTGSSAVVEITYTDPFAAAYYPASATGWNDTQFQATGTVLKAGAIPASSIEVALVSYVNTSSVSFTVTISNEAYNGQTVAEFTAARDNHCLSCLDPSALAAFSDPVYWCTDTNQCESGNSPTCTSVSTVKSCITDEGKTEDPVCEITRDLRATKTPKSLDITLPSDSYCIITLKGITQRMKIAYEGLGAVYYPSTDEWDGNTLQPSQTQLSSVSNRRILQGSGTTELKVAIVNYHLSSSEIFTVEVDDPSVPDDDGLSGGQIAGIVIGSLALLAVVAAAIVWGVMAIKRKQSNTSRKKINPVTEDSDILVK